MSNIESRIRKLEKQSGGNKPRAIIVYVQGESETESEAAKEKAIAEYRAKHPEWEPATTDCYIRVTSEKAKELTHEIMNGVKPHAE